MPEGKSSLLHAPGAARAALGPTGHNWRAAPAREAEGIQLGDGVAVQAQEVQSCRKSPEDFRFLFAQVF